MGSLQLGLPRVVQIWANQLAELDPVPAEKLDVLLRVCGGSSGNEGECVHQQMLLLGWLTGACKAPWPCSWQGQLVSATNCMSNSIAMTTLSCISTCCACRSGTTEGVAAVALSTEV
jgi:hypothetical protein